MSIHKIIFSLMICNIITLNVYCAEPVTVFGEDGMDFPTPHSGSCLADHYDEADIPPRVYMQARGDGELKDDGSAKPPVNPSSDPCSITHTWESDDTVYAYKCPSGGGVHSAHNSRVTTMSFSGDGTSSGEFVPSATEDGKKKAKIATRSLLDQQDDHGNIESFADPVPIVASATH